MRTEVWTPVFIGIGSNLDDPASQVRLAAERLAALPHCRWVRGSALYRSAPMGPADQPDFVNAVAALLSTLMPKLLVRALLDLEQSLGRQRDGRRWGPRRIDLDLLVHGDTVHDDSELTVPHPGIAERAFVACPLAGLAPWLRLPDGRRVADIAAGMDCSQLTRIGDLDKS